MTQLRYLFALSVSGHSCPIILRLSESIGFPNNLESEKNSLEVKTRRAARKGAARLDWQCILVRENHGIDREPHHVGNRDARGIALVVPDHVFARGQAGKIAAIAGTVAYEPFPSRSLRRVRCCSGETDPRRFERLL